MTVKQLKEKLAEIPEDLDDAEVYVYSGIDEGADGVCNVKVYDEAYYNDKEKFNYYGTPHCRGDAPWDLVQEDGALKVRKWEGSPAFVVIG